MKRLPPPVGQLDLAKIGLGFVNLLATSTAAGHAHIWDTVRDYVHAPDESPEAAFVREAFQLRASDAAAKWFGSELDAQAYITGAIEGAEDGR